MARILASISKSSGEDEHVGLSDLEGGESSLDDKLAKFRRSGKAEGLQRAAVSLHTMQVIIVTVLRASVSLSPLVVHRQVEDESRGAEETQRAVPVPSAHQRLAGCKRCVGNCITGRPRCPCEYIVMA